MDTIIFIDTEVSQTDNKAYDFGAINEKGEKLHTGCIHEFESAVILADIYFHRVN